MCSSCGIFPLASLWVTLRGSFRFAPPAIAAGLRDPLDPAMAADIARRNHLPLSAVPASPAGTLKLHELSERANAALPERIDDLAADQIPWNNPR